MVNGLQYLMLVAALQYLILKRFCKFIDLYFLCDRLRFYAIHIQRFFHIKEQNSLKRRMNMILFCAILSWNSLSSFVAHHHHVPITIGSNTAHEGGRGARLTYVMKAETDQSGRLSNANNNIRVSKKKMEILLKKNYSLLYR